MVGPDYQRPVTPAELAGKYVYASLERSDPNAVFGGPWWAAFEDPVTNELVEAALLNNTELAAAAAGVMQAEAAVRQIRGQRFPQIDYNLSRARTKMSFSLPEIGRVNFWNTTFDQSLDISYITDLFGRLRRAERAAFNELLSTEANLRALEHAIIAQVISTRVEIATQQKLLAIAVDNVESWEQNYEIVDRRYREGLVGPVDVYIVKENLASARAQVSQIRQTLIESFNALDVLLGRIPATTRDLPPLLDPLPELEPVPVGLPAQLLDRRPDVRAAEFQLAAAVEQIGVNIAAMYPDLVLTGSAGYTGDVFEDLANSEAKVYSAVIGAALPIFYGGQLRAGVDAAEAAARQAAAQYAGTVLTAMQEVEDALVREREVRRRIEYLDDRLFQALQAERLARTRYGEGVDNILLVLETERARRQAENELAVARGGLWQARIQLMLALGGDWGPAVPPEEDAVPINEVLLEEPVVNE